MRSQPIVGSEELGSGGTTTATIVAGDLEVGAVEIKNAATDDRAAVKTASAVATTDLALAISDPVAAAVGGTTADAAVTTSANGTISAKLRGLVSLLAHGQATGANSVPVVLASDQAAVQTVGSIASGSADSGNPVKAGGRYNSSAPTLTNGQRGDLQLDAAANLLVTLATAIAGEDVTNNVHAVQAKPVAGSAYSPSASIAFATSTAISAKGSAGNIKSLSCSNANAAARFVQVHNKATAPSAADVPIFSFTIPAGTAAQPGIREIGTDFFGEGGFYLGTGVALAVSTVAGSYTAATASDHMVNATYV